MKLERMSMSVHQSMLTSSGLFSLSQFVGSQISSLPSHLLFGQPQLSRDSLLDVTTSAFHKIKICRVGEEAKKIDEDLVR